MTRGALSSRTGALCVEDANRSYLLIHPSSADLAQLPVVIDLHGSGSNPREHAEVTTAEMTAARGALVVLPYAAIPFRLFNGGPSGWAWNVPSSPLPNEFHPRGAPDDMAFIDTLIDRLVDVHGVDPHRIHLRGYSGGARLGSHLLAKFTTRFRSVSFVSGVRFVAGQYTALPPVLAIHGQRDTFNPYDGGSGPRWDTSVPNTIRDWAEASRCLPTPREEVITEGVTSTSYTDANTGFARVRLLSISPAQHSWPGTSHANHIAQFGDAGRFSATDALWNFTIDAESVPPLAATR